MGIYPWKPGNLFEIASLIAVKDMSFNAASNVLDSTDTIGKKFFRSRKKESGISDLNPGNKRLKKHGNKKKLYCLFVKTDLKILRRCGRSISAAFLSHSGALVKISCV